MDIRKIHIGQRLRGYFDEGSEDQVSGARCYHDFTVVNILGRLEEVESEEGEIFHVDDVEEIPDSNKTTMTATRTVVDAKTIQKRIDHYSAVSASYHELCQETENADEALRYHGLMMFYSGKSDVYVDLIKELFPSLEGERACPFDENAHENIKNMVKAMHNHAQ